MSFALTVARGLDLKEIQYPETHYVFGGFPSGVWKWAKLTVPESWPDTANARGPTRSRGGMPPRQSRITVKAPRQRGWAPAVVVATVFIIG